MKNQTPSTQTPCLLVSLPRGLRCLAELESKVDPMVTPTRDTTMSQPLDTAGLALFGKCLCKCDEGQTLR
jgi:hypothetical protein